MKKVGIMTFHGSHNYGSVLQAYAISQQVKSMGYSVEIINLRNQAQRDAYRVFQTKGSGAKRILHTLYSIKNYPASKRRAKNFEYFINNILPTTEKCYSSGEELLGRTDYDIYLCGSDQIWNPACQDFESAYYLDFVNNGARRVSYAPSLGKTGFDPSHLELIRSLLPNVDTISCREEKGAAVLRKLTDRQVTVVCDPVVLLGREEWEKFARPPKIKKPYILTYFLENNHGTKKFLKELQEHTGYEVVSLNEDIRDLGKGYTNAFDASPEEFVGLFKNAALVYTNSFHGTAFATIFNRPLVTVIGEKNESNNNDSRKIDYLKALGLECCIVTDKLPQIDSICERDYLVANEKMQTMRENSYRYLNDALEGTI